MSDQSTAGSDRTPTEPKVNDDGTITLYGGGPSCPGCGGPTHAVTGDGDAERPWWCQECNVRLDDSGEPGAAASFPAGNEPNGGASDDE